VLRLARAVAALGEHRFPVEHTDATRPFHAAFSALTGQDGVPELAAAGLRHSAVPTMLAAGYKLNVIPGEAIAEVDTRVVPGGEEEFRREVERVVGEDVSVEWVLSNAPVVSPVDGPLVQTVREAVAHDDPDGVVVPYLLAASTDNKNFSRLGIAGYGFTPLRVPAGFDAFGQFHAVDERVPLAALRFGARVLRRILQTA
jgi:acetylornithine deacetylase/succinyl-diaminopimelate desuccinylase-like protein